MKEKPARECSEDGCHIDISHKGNRATRCTEHQKAFHASRQRDRYSRVKDTVSTRRILRRQGAAEYEGPHEDIVIDYRKGDAAPSFSGIAATGRQHWTHDNATRIRTLAAMNSASDEDATMSSWDELSSRQSDARVYFPPAPGSPITESGFRGGRERPHVVDFPEVDGVAFSAPNVAGRAAASAHAHDRWGGRVQPAPPIDSAQLQSAVPYVQQREAAQAAQVRQADEHARSLGWTRR